MTITYECELVFCHGLFVILDWIYNLYKLHISKSTIILRKLYIAPSSEMVMIFTNLSFTVFQEKFRGLK